MKTWKVKWFTELIHVTSEEFMEDGIPHVEMILECGTCLGF